MKVALTYDWLTGMRGGEKCFEIFCELFPDADIFTLLHNKGSVSETIERMKIKTSFIHCYHGHFTSISFISVVSPPYASLNVKLN